jgi:hypothetical protein
LGVAKLWSQCSQRLLPRRQACTRKFPNFANCCKHWLHLYIRTDAVAKRFSRTCVMSYTRNVKLYYVTRQLQRPPARVLNAP